MRTLRITLACFAALALWVWLDRSETQEPRNSNKVDKATLQLRQRTARQTSAKHPSLFQLLGPTSEAPVQDQASKQVSNAGTDRTQAIIAQYRHSQKQDLDARWAMIEALAKIDSVHSANFLASIALAPLPAPEAPELTPLALVPNHTHQGCNMGSPKDQMLEMAPREWSAAAIVRMFLRSSAHPEQLDAVVKHLLQHASPQVSKYAAMTLFSYDALRDEHRDMLDARGVFHNFRFLSEQEQQRLFRSDKIALLPQGQAQ